MAALRDAVRAAPAGARTRPHITVRGLKKRFNEMVVYDGFDFDIPRGKIISVFGPNGCGKSTLINLMAGLIPKDGGEILFDGMQVEDVRIGYVFQNYREALFPWLRARDNIEYPLKFLKYARPERRRRVEAGLARPERRLGAGEVIEHHRERQRGEIIL